MRAVPYIGEVDLCGSLPCAAWCVWQNMNSPSQGYGHLLTGVASKGSSAGRRWSSLRFTARAFGGSVRVEWSSYCQGRRLNFCDSHQVKPRVGFNQVPAQTLCDVYEREVLQRSQNIYIYIMYIWKKRKENSKISHFARQMRRLAERTINENEVKIR